MLCYILCWKRWYMKTKIFLSNEANLTWALFWSFTCLWLTTNMDCVLHSTFCGKPVNYTSPDCYLNSLGISLGIILAAVVGVRHFHICPTATPTGTCKHLTLGMATTAQGLGVKRGVCRNMQSSPHRQLQMLMLQHPLQQNTASRSSFKRETGLHISGAVYHTAGSSHRTHPNYTAPKQIKKKVTKMFWLLSLMILTWKA